MEGLSGVEEQVHLRDRRKKDFVETCTYPAMCVTFLLEPYCVLFVVCPSQQRFFSPCRRFMSCSNFRREMSNRRKRRSSRTR